MLSLLSSVALALPLTVSEEIRPIQAPPGVYAELVDSVIDEGFDPDWVDEILEDMSGRAPRETRALRLYGLDHNGQPKRIRELLPRPPRAEPKEPGVVKSAANNPGAATGFLNGRAVYMSQCHGWIWQPALDRFGTQRGNNFGSVEDFHNPEGANEFLLKYLENAGAAVYATKERDQNTNMAIADNDGSGYSETGAGFVDGDLGFEANPPYIYGENPFDLGTTRSFPADGGGVATWIPVVPEDGYYNVYVSWDSNSAHATDAHYRISHPGGVIDRYYDQTVHGSTWQYVENLWLTAGTSLTVELVGDSSQTGALINADAVRIGGGMGDVERHGEVTERPRWEGGAIQYTQFNGAPSSIYDPYGDGFSDEGGSDPTARSRWAEWEHPAGEDAIYLSWHSNATESGTARGTVTYYDGEFGTEGSFELASYVQDGIMDQIFEFWDPNWYDRGLNTANFSEVNSSNNDEMPSALIELAFHDNADDSLYLKHPKFREDVSRGMYRGIVEYFAWDAGVAPAFLPEPPTHVTLRHVSTGELQATWEPGASGAPLGDPADEYLVYTSSDGRSWDNGFSATGTSATIPAADGELVYVRVVGVNEGGQSFPSEVVGAVRSPDGYAPVLVVNAFDRMDRGLLRTEYVTTLGDLDRMNPRMMNDGTIVVPHGNAIYNAGWTFDSASDEALADIDLELYYTVVWATGEESTVDETFSDDQQAQLDPYYYNGGTLWVSGSEVLWDLDSQGGTTDQDFAFNILGATLADDDAGTNLVDGEGILAGMALDFGLGAGGPYPVEYPDVLDTTRTVAARYATGGVAVTIDEGVAMFGFPFDAIVDEGVASDAAGAILTELIPYYTPPTLPTDPNRTTTDPEDPDPTDPTTSIPTDGTTPDTEPTEGDVDVEPPTRGSLDKKGCGCTHSAPMFLGWVPMLLVTWRRRSW